jgi:hypothetical protein
LKGTFYEGIFVADALEWAGELEEGCAQVCKVKGTKRKRNSFFFLYP